MTIMLSFTALKLTCWTSQNQQTVCESLKTSKQSCFARVYLYLYCSGFVTERTFVFTKESMIQNFRMNYIKLERDVQHCRRAQRAQIHVKRNNLVQCYSIFISSTLYFLINIPIINERVSISIFVSTEKITEQNLIMGIVPNL